MDLHHELIEAARAEGFPLAGALDLDRALEASGTGSFAMQVQAYDRWIETGRAGAMTYLERGRGRRADPRQVFPAAQSILCVALPYPASPAGTEASPRYARYLQGPDYHLEIAARLDRALEKVRGRWDGPPLEWKTCVDTSAVLERTWATLAGLGWIGKNSMLIHPKLGSYLFLAEVFVNQPVGRGPAPLPDLCGHCDRCQRACPTQAIVADRVLDSTRCISYWTLEKRGELPIDDTARKRMGTWVAGCDLCQEACPFNTKASRAADPAAVPPNSTERRDWEALLTEDEASYRERVHASALKRVKPAQFSRNLAIAVGNHLASLTAPEAQDFCARHQRGLAIRIAEGWGDESSRAEWERVRGLLR